MTNPDNNFKVLQDELRKEASLEPKNRSKEYENLTLQYFLEYGRRTEDHDLWRECHMLEEMVAIMDRRFMALNPHKRRQQELNQILAGASKKLNDKQFVALHEYEEEVGNEGYSQMEADSEQATLYPDVRRHDIEIQAAENYLEATWGIRRKHTPTELAADDLPDKITKKNPNPILNLRELIKELEKVGYEDSAARTETTRSINKWFGKRKHPWPIGGCAAEYQIVESEIKEGKDKPTPAWCKYQKIYRENED